MQTDHEMTKTLTLPTIIAHRGASQLAPENTLSSFEKAYESGAKMFECDLQLTSDGHVVLMHDFKLNRTTDGNGKLSEQTYSSIETLSAGKWFSSNYRQERIPTLEKLINRANHLQIAVNLELKVDERIEKAPETCNKLSEQTLDTVKRLWSQQAPLPLISSANPQCLARLRELNCPYPLAYITDNWHDNCLKYLHQYDCFSLHINHKHLNDQILRHIHEAGFKVLCYTVNNHKTVKKLLDMGVDALFTDKMEILRQYQNTVEQNKPYSKNKD